MNDAKTTRKCAVCSKKVFFPFDYCSSKCSAKDEALNKLTPEYAMGQAEIAAKCQ